jgi:aminopeptidase N
MLPDRTFLHLVIISFFWGLIFPTRSLAQQPPISRDEFLQTRQLLTEKKQTQLERRRLLRPSAVSAAQNQYDVKYYKLNLDIDPIAAQISGFVEIKAEVTVDNFQSVELDLYSNMAVDSVGGDAGTFSHDNDRLQVQLAQARQSGELFTLQVNYHGRPRSDGFGSFGFDFHDGVPIIWTLSEPYFARAWWPCKDTPSDKADSVDVILTVPDGLTAASNGSLVSNTDNGDGTRTFHWHEAYPITTYLVSLAITNYATYSESFNYSPDASMEVQYYIYPEALDDAQERLNQTLTMLTFFHEVFGPYPFLSEKYGIAQFPWGGGMEHQTITSQGSFGVSLTAHELAHQWWGDKITTANWQEIWLNEGFASYAEALYFEHTDGTEFYHTYMGWNDSDFPHPLYVDDTTTVRRIFHRTVYDKGAWFLHMLRHIVGDSTFFDILLAYSQDPRFAYGNATTAGFQEVCESVSGTDLDWFFQPWIYEIGRPTYRVEWCPEQASGTDILSLKIEQTQYLQQGLFPMPIDITVQTGLGDTTVTVFNDSAQQTFEIALSARPINILFDKDDWILKYVESVTLIDGTTGLPSGFSLQQNYPNPFGSAINGTSNSATLIQFNIPETAQVRLVIYNLLGQKVRTLRDEDFEPGSHVAQWDGRDDSGVRVGAGVYLYRIKAGDFVEKKKMTLMW